MLAGVRRALTSAVSFGCAPLVVSYQVHSPRWNTPDIKIVVVSDLHVCWPWTSLQALLRVVAKVNALTPDLILLPGDFLVGRKLPSNRATAEQIAKILGGLCARLGVFASLGNHDWTDCPVARKNGFTGSSVVPALRQFGIEVLVNSAIPIQDGKDKFWLVGFDSQDGQTATARSAERHDPERSFADVPVGASVILMAHEPDYFAKGDARPSLQISGHTHAGQLNLFGWRPLTPSRYGGRFAHGLVSKAEGRLIVSAGLGYSGLPLRIGAPSEISVVYLTGTSG
jgi:predicted MPP superfamily phosphohydrolase